MLTQAIILILSLVSGFILPKYMGTKMFGYWQIYLFYLAYLNLFGLGFNDGIALYYGGYQYKDLPFKRLQNATRLFFIYLIILTCLSLVLISFVSDSDMKRIYYILALSIPATCIQCIVLTTFLSVNRTGIYNIINLLTKLLAVVSYLLLIFSGITKSEPMMYMDFAVRIIITIICIVLGRDFLFGKDFNLAIGWQELLEKSKSGFNITIALIASMFIPVAGRVIIEWNETKENYGIYAFAMSVLSMIIMFTNTAGTVIFPTLKRLKQDHLVDYFDKFSFVCNSLIYVSFFAYMPVAFIIRHYMQEYVPALAYLPILLAMCLPLGKMQLLITSYYKALRLEKTFLIVNIVGAAAMLLGTSVAYFSFHSVLSVAVATTIILTVWCAIVENYLRKQMKSQFDIKGFMIQIVMMCMFITAASFNNFFVFILLYGIALALYFFIYRSQCTIVLKRNRR